MKFLICRIELPNVQECDATDDDRSNAALYIKIFFARFDED
jgi:hypothetical protein